MSRRRDNRVAAMQFLYQWSINDSKDLAGSLALFFEEMEQPRDYYSFGEELIHGAIENVEEVDSVITKYLRNWDFDRIMTVIGVKEGMHIGEAGAGDGFFTFHLSGEVGPEGMVYANDISSSALNRMKNRAEREGIKNIRQVTGRIADPDYPVKELEMIVIVHAFHDFSQPVEWLRNARKYVKKGGKLVIIDKDPDRWGQGWYHFQSREEVLSLLSRAGIKDVKVEDFMPEDNIYLGRF